MTEEEAKDKWSALCTNQGWNVFTQFSLFVEFVMEQKLFAKFTQYADKVADEENGRTW